jgi:hypothetical protein
VADTTSTLPIHDLDRYWDTALRTRMGCMAVHRTMIQHYSRQGRYTLSRPLLRPWFQATLCGEWTRHDRCAEHGKTKAFNTFSNIAIVLDSLCRQVTYFTFPPHPTFDTTTFSCTWLAMLHLVEAYKMARQGLPRALFLVSNTPDLKRYHQLRDQLPPNTKRNHQPTHQTNDTAHDVDLS